MVAGLFFICIISVLIAESVHGDISSSVNGTYTNVTSPVDDAAHNETRSLVNQVQGDLASSVNETVTNVTSPVDDTAHNETRSLVNQVHGDLASSLNGTVTSNVTSPVDDAAHNATRRSLVNREDYQLQSAAVQGNDRLANRYISDQNSNIVILEKNQPEKTDSAACKNAEFFKSVLSVVVPLLSNDVSQRTKIGYVLEILKGLMQTTAEPVQDREVIYKINDLLRTLEKHAKTPEMISYPNVLRESDNNGNVKSKIIFKYETPKLPNPKCTAALINIVKVIKNALAQLINNPICRSKVPIIPNIETLNDYPFTQIQKDKSPYSFENDPANIDITKYFIKHPAGQPFDDPVEIDVYTEQPNLSLPAITEKPLIDIDVNGPPVVSFENLPRQETIDTPILYDSSPNSQSLINGRPDYWYDTGIPRYMPFDQYTLPNKDYFPMQRSTPSPLEVNPHDQHRSENGFELDIPLPVENPSAGSENKLPIYSSDGTDIHIGGYTPKSSVEIDHQGYSPSKALLSAIQVSGSSTGYIPIEQSSHQPLEIYTPTESPSNIEISGSGVGYIPIDEYSRKEDIAIHSHKQYPSSIEVAGSGTGYIPINQSPFEIYTQTKRPSGSDSGYIPINQPDDSQNPSLDFINTERPSIEVSGSGSGYIPFDQSPNLPVDNIHLPKERPERPSYIEVYGAENGYIPMHTQPEASSSNEFDIRPERFPSIEMDMQTKTPNKEVYPQQEMPSSFEVGIQTDRPSSIEVDSQPERPSSFEVDIQPESPSSVEVDIHPERPYSIEVDLSHESKPSYLDMSEPIHTINSQKGRPVIPVEYQTFETSLLYPILMRIIEQNNYKPNVNKILKEYYDILNNKYPDTHIQEIQNYKYPKNVYSQLPKEFNVHLHPNSPNQIDHGFFPETEEMKPVFPDEGFILHNIINNNVPYYKEIPEYIPVSTEPNYAVDVPEFTVPGYTTEDANILDYNTLPSFLQNEAGGINPNQHFRPEGVSPDYIPGEAYLPFQYPNSNSHIPEDSSSINNNIGPFGWDSQNENMIPNNNYLSMKNYVSNPDLQLLVIIKDNIATIEKHIPHIHYYVIIHKNIEKIKDLIYKKQISIEEYINILQLYEIVIDEIKKLDIGNNILNDLLSGVSNTNKLKHPSEKSHLVEFTYLVKRPQPIIYQPYYYIKYRLPYLLYLRKMKKLLRIKPQLRMNPSNLYKELIPMSHVAETSPDLKSFGKEDILNLTFNNGTLVGTKVISERDSDLLTTLDSLREINSESTVQDFVGLINKLNVQNHGKPVDIDKVSDGVGRDNINMASVNMTNWKLKSDDLKKQRKLNLAGISNTSKNNLNMHTSPSVIVRPSTIPISDNIQEIKYNALNDLIVSNKQIIQAPEFTSPSFGPGGANVETHLREDYPNREIDSELISTSREKSADSDALINVDSNNRLIGLKLLEATNNPYKINPDNSEKQQSLSYFFNDPKFNSKSYTNLNNLNIKSTANLNDLRSIKSSFSNQADANSQEINDLTTPFRLNRNKNISGIALKLLEATIKNHNFKSANFPTDQNKSNHVNQQQRSYKIAPTSAKTFVYHNHNPTLSVRSVPVQSNYQYFLQQRTPLAYQRNVHFKTQGNPVRAVAPFGTFRTS